jgi:hypothetical protein
MSSTRNQRPGRSKLARMEESVCTTLDFSDERRSRMPKTKLFIGS